MAQDRSRRTNAARGPSPRQAVRLEMLRALGAGALLVPRTVRYLAQRRGLRAELLGDIARPAAIGAIPKAAIPSDRPLTFFVACAEVSGETHACNVVAAIQRRAAAARAPSPRFVGFGGTRLQQQAVELLGRPIERAQMGFGVASSIPYYTRLLQDAAQHLRTEPVDVCLAVDSPALHVPLMHIARRYGVRTLHFVTPQYWGWAPWRARGYRDAVDLALSILPFEPEWFARRGVRVAHVGHPLQDELARVPATTPHADAREIVILPGSRGRVIARNLAWMLGVVRRLRREIGDVPVVVAHDRAELAAELRSAIDAAGASAWARLEIGGLHDVLARARCAVSVSGTVLLDLLHHDLPTVVVYRLDSRIEAALKDRVLTVPWFSSVNLLAASEVYPEFCFRGAGPVDRVGEALRRCYNDAAWRAQCRAGLALARARLGPPGACDRAAAHAIALAASPP